MDDNDIEFSKENLQKELEIKEEMLNNPSKDMQKFIDDLLTTKYINKNENRRYRNTFYKRRIKKSSQYKIFHVK